MQADQTVLSLRPGGGNRGSSRLLLAPLFDSPAFAAAASGGATSDISVLRPHGGALHRQTGDSRFEARERIRYTRDQLLQLREVVEAPEDIIKIKNEIESEFSVVEQPWVHNDASLSSQQPSRYYESDNRDWRNKPAGGEERPRDTARELHPSNQWQHETNQSSSRASSQGAAIDLLVIQPLALRSQNDSFEGARVMWERKREPCPLRRCIREPVD